MRIRKAMQGVTLMELMIVVVVIGILAAIGYPNYREFAARAKRTEARALLLEIAITQEKFYLQNHIYGDLTDLGYVADTVETDSDSYSVTVNSFDANSFVAQASFLLGGPEAGKCLWFRIDGNHTQTSFPETDCWSRTR